MSLQIPNALAERYASDEMKSIWSASGKVVLEREFWIAVMKAQRELGLKIEKTAIESSEKAKMRVDLESIRRREQTSKHDVKARLEEFAELAGHQHAHKGMTSRDLTENVEQLQIHRSLSIVLEKSIAALLALVEKAKEHRSLPLTARSHNVPAQLTTLGKFRRRAVDGRVEPVILPRKVHIVAEHLETPHVKQHGVGCRET